MRWPNNSRFKKDEQLNSEKNKEHKNKNISDLNREQTNRTKPKLFFIEKKIKKKEAQTILRSKQRASPHSLQTLKAHIRRGYMKNFNLKNLTT